MAVFQIALLTFASLVAGLIVGLAIGRRRGVGTQVQLLESRGRAAAIVDAAVDGIVTIDEHGRVESFNRAAEAIFGYRADEVIGCNVKVLMPEPYRSGLDRYLANYLATGEARIIGIGREVVGQRKDGSTFSMDLAVGESRVSGRRIFAGIIRDITARKRVEEALRVSEERFRVLVDTIQDYAITLIDAQGVVMSWNPGAERLYGWTAEEMVGAESSRFYPLEAVTDGRPALALGAAATDGCYQEEGWRQRKDGSRFWAHVTVWAVRGDDGGLRGFARISRDMTAQKRYEDDLRQARDAAERANAAKTKFLAAASHDLRQPVQALLFFTSVLSHKLRGHPAQGLLRDLQSSVDGLNILLDSLLDVSKLDAGLVTPKETDFGVAAILDRLAGEFQPLAADKGIELRMVPSSLMIRSDPALLSRVVQNLVANAVRYTTRGRVLLGCRRHGAGTLRIEVWDTGIGIPPERTGEIFEEFTQLGNPERDRTQGLGLGLAIVDRLTRLLGHRVTLRSEVGKGSAFAVEVPLAGVPAARPGRARRPSPSAPAAGGVVVLIDDEAIVLRGLSLVLEGWGYKVVAAASLDEAVQRLATLQQTPAVILADYRLREGRTGTEAVRSLRELFRTAIPSIIITGDTAPERLREAEASGLSILHKPIQPPALRRALRETLASPRGMLH